MRPLTNAQRRGHATSKARAQARLAKARELSAANATREEAASAIGVTIAGLRSLLQREVGSSRWPIAHD